LQDTFFRQFLSQALEMVLIFRENGKIEFANSKANELLEYEDLSSVLISDIFPEVFSVEKDRVVILKGTQQEVLEEMAYRQNRTCFAVNLKVFPLNTPEGNSYVCMALDATKQNYLEHRANMADAQMESAVQLKSQFVANVTHELRTPVNGILGNVLQLQKMEEDPSKMKMLNLMERGCKDMHSIINNILDFSKLDAGKLELEQKEFVFRDLMEYIKSNHINKISEKGLEFFMNISPEVPEVIVGDELRIGQILNNFLSNATKFTSTGRITVEVVKTAQMGKRVELFFMVMDTGIGIDKEDQDKLFKSFSQVEASISRRFGGTGLGLNISKQLVEMMGGNVHVESEKNKGSMFSFHIWVENPAIEGSAVDNQMHSYNVELPKFDQMNENKTNDFGTPENFTEIEKKLSKLILCIEMDNWEKAEMFTEALKQLTAEGPQPIKSAMLRLKMAVQKADREKAVVAFDTFRQAIKEIQA